VSYNIRGGQPNM